MLVRTVYADHPGWNGNLRSLLSGLSTTTNRVITRYGRMPLQLIVIIKEIRRKSKNETSSYTKLNWDAAVFQAHKYLPFTIETYPKFIERMKGIAKGASVSFDDVLVGKNY